MSPPAKGLVVRPLTPSRWPHFETLFGDNGACGGCWCMYWRLPRKQFTAGKYAGNRDAMRALVAAGARPGLLAYRDGEAIGWCSLAPRVAFPSLTRSRLFQALLDEGESATWSVSCLFVRRDHRRTGVSVALLRAAVEDAKARGARALEGYPQEPTKSAMADAFAWTGVASAFRAAGFREVARPSPTRPVMRVAFGALRSRATRAGTTRASRTS